MKLPTNLKSHLNKFFLTYVTTFFSLYVFFFVDQIQRIWYQTPPISAGPAVIIGYSSFMMFTILYCVLAIIEVIFKTVNFPILKLLYKFPVLKRLWLCGRFASFDWLLFLIRRQPKMRLMMGLIGLIAGAYMLFFGPKADASMGSWYPLSGTLCHTSGLIIVLISLWCIARAVRLGSQRLGEYRLFQGLFTIQLIRVLTWFVETLIVTEIIWLLASNSHITNHLISYRLYTIWTCFIYFTILIIIASVIDKWAMNTLWPVRLLAIGVVVLFLWDDRAKTVDRDDYQNHQDKTHAVTLPAKEKSLLRFLNTKLEDMKTKDGPVVIIAASGGGSRAAIFTSLVFEMLQRTPINGEFHSDDNRLTQRSWADNIIMVSSVSGGSLATAHFVQKMPDWPAPRSVLQNTTKKELIELIPYQIRDELAAIVSNLNDSMEQGIDDSETKSVKNELLKQMNPFWELVSHSYANDKSEKRVLLKSKHYPNTRVIYEAIRKCKITVNNPILNETIRQLNCLMSNFEYYYTKNENINAVPLGIIPANHWVLQSPNFDDMSMDFMAPVMRGLLSPRLDRGDALCRFWTEKFKWHDASNFEGYSHSTDSAAYETRYHPAVLFNATDVRDGKRLVATFPPNSANFWGPVYESNPPKRLTTMSEFDENQCLSLSRAVRMSSNFPFGFRVLEFLPPNSAVNEKQKEPLHVLDGGVVDNTGIDTLYEAFRGFEFYEKRKTELENKMKALEKSNQEKDRKELETIKQQIEFAEVPSQFLTALRKRTVLFIEIDAGAKPSQESGGLFAAINEPLNALGNSAYLNSELNKQFYINEIRRILCRAPGKPDDCPTVLHYRFECNHYDPTHSGLKNDVMTAWTLAPQDKANVLCRFMLEQDRWQQESNRVKITLEKSDSVLKKIEELNKASEQINTSSKELIDDLSKRLVNFDQKTQDEADKLKERYSKIEKDYENYISQINKLQEQQAGILGLGKQKEQMLQLKATLVNTASLLQAKNVAIQMKKLQDAKLVGEKFNPQSKLDKSAAESQKNLGKNIPKN